MHQGGTKSEWKTQLKLLLDSKAFEDAIDLVVRNQEQIERDIPKDTLSPWFEIRGVCSVVNDILTSSADLGESLGAHLLSAHPGFRAGIVAVGQWRLENGFPETAIPLFESALASRVDDLFVQDLLASAHLLVSGGKSRGGQAPLQNWQGRYCNVPFEHFEPIQNGEVFVCCPTHVPFPIGNIYKHSIEEIWNSDTVKEIRNSILDGSFRYCSKLHCDRILGNTLPLRTEITNQLPTTEVADLPKEVVLNHDRSCNLSCPSCRTEMITSDSKERQGLDSVRSEIVRISNSAEQLVITNAGDPFASKHYRSILQEIRPPKDQWLKLYTNAQLFTQQEWDKLEHLHGVNVIVDISIDAVQSDTYQALRRGGSFDRLLKNLELVSRLRREEKLKKFTINMTVQRRNLLEMVDFAKWGISLGCDLVYFLRIRNWGTFSVEEFLDLDVCAPGHPLFPKYREIVQDEVFKDRRVSLATLPRFEA